MMWLLLVVAGLLEVIGVTGITMVNKRKTALAWTMLIGGFGLSFICLSVAMQFIPMGTAYAVWTGIGTAGSTLVGMVVYKEPRDKKRILFLSLILLSVIGLKLVS